jgi:RNA polymerase sigma factor (sigma-70 family)
MSENPYATEDDLDAQLINSLRDGDGSAAAFLVSRHTPRLLGYAAAVANDISETDRELICEHVVETAAAKIDDFDPTKGSFPGWLRGILRNEIKSWRRRYPATVELDEQAIAAPSDDDQPPSADEPDPSAVLSPLLEQLAASDLLMIRLRDLEELPYSVIAESLGAREDACRQRHRRALQRLALLAAKESNPHTPDTEELRSER